MSFNLASKVQSNIWTLFEFREILCNYLAKIMRQFTYPNCKVAWEFGLQICGGAQLLGWSHLVDQTSTTLIFCSTWLVEVSLVEIKDDIWICNPSFTSYNLKIQTMFHTPFPCCKTLIFPCFKILQTYPNLTIKKVRKHHWVKCN